MGLFEEAEEKYKLALQADPNNADTHCNSGILLSDMGRREEAEEQYKVAIELDPKMQIAMMLMVYFYFPRISMKVRNKTGSLCSFSFSTPNHI